MIQQICDTHSNPGTGRPGERGPRTGQGEQTGRTRGRRTEGVNETSITTGNKSFEVRCEPHDQRHALIATLGLSLSVGQRIRRNGRDQMWDSIIVRCAEEGDGTLAVRILISNPDWEELLQIAHIRSRPDDEESLTALGCNLDHIAEKNT